MKDNLEHGWIVDGVEKCEYDVEVPYHCHKCWEELKDGEYVYKGFGKYICNKCLSEEIDVQR